MTSPTPPTKKDASFFMRRIFQFVNNEETQKQVQIYLLDPLINHIMERVFPYIVLTCVLFVLLLILVVLILGIIIFQLRKVGHLFTGGGTPDAFV